MAKAPAAPALPSTPYPLSLVDAIPEAGKFGRSAANDAVTQTIRNMPTPVNGKFASFELTAQIADTITDPQQKQKASKEAQNKLMSSTQAKAKRVAKTIPGAEYAVRRVDGSDLAVRIYRKS